MPEFQQTRTSIDIFIKTGDVIPGDPEESDLYQKLVESDPDDIMPPPPYSPLDQPLIDSIYNWILYGALDDYCGVYCDTSNISFSSTIEPIINLRCKSCHSGPNPNGGVSLNNYSDVASLASSGFLMNVLLGDGAPLMPEGGALPTELVYDDSQLGKTFELLSDKGSGTLIRE